MVMILAREPGVAGHIGRCPPNLVGPALPEQGVVRMGRTKPMKNQGNESSWS